MLNTEKLLNLPEHFNPRRALPSPATNWRGLCRRMSVSPEIAQHLVDLADGERDAQGWQAT